MSPFIAGLGAQTLSDEAMRGMVGMLMIGSVGVIGLIVGLAFFAMYRLTPRLGRSEHASVDLYWLPLGAGDASHCVRWNGRIYEALAAFHERRQTRDLYHSALEVTLGTDRFMIEMAPVWGNTHDDRGVVSGGSVGIPWLGHSRFFRYEVRRWRNGRIPDISEAVASPQRLSSDIVRAERVLELVPAFPTVTWGRDELHTGDMWNSNSLTSWLLARSGHETELVEPPAHGRAPGWSGGLVLAARQAELGGARAA